MLEGLTPPLGNSLCLVSKRSLELDEKDQEVLEASLSDPRWSTAALRKALDERGFVVGETALRKHRAKECNCARESK